jgi:putative oxidoreductase
MITVINKTSRYFYKPDMGIFLIRLALGLLFFTHGLAKVQELSMVTAMFVHLGFFPWVGFFIAWLEVIGGLALILGVATRVFAVAFGIEMLVAAVIVGFSHGIGIELVLSFLSFGLALLGSGYYSVFKMECDNCGGMLCNGETGECVAVE